ncbi:hypothetical protein V4D30_09805 [Thermodesulfovibrio sp. 3907-1M]|uniref:Uncharacterized protein n=1 Tax=Thermodesulfovibrio autotrophicus TaxID=3118333 RepID=A0AAU8GZB8_9BACT
MLKLKKRLEELETTKVWIFPEKDFEERLNKNIIERYSQKGSYSIINFFTHSGFIPEIKSRTGKRQIKNKYELMIIKANVQEAAWFEPEQYFGSLKEMIERVLPDLKDKGFLVIQTNDVRINGYVEPLAKKIVDLITHENLWLKEIVLVTNNKSQEESNSLIGYLKIVHEYLLVYNVANGTHPVEALLKANLDISPKGKFKK